MNEMEITVNRKVLGSLLSISTGGGGGAAATASSESHLIELMAVDGSGGSREGEESSEAPTLSACHFHTTSTSDK